MIFSVVGLLAVAVLLGIVFVGLLPQRARDFFFDWLAFPLLILLVIGALLCAVFAVDRAACLNAWEHSGFQARWQLVGPCMISRDGKVWIPGDVSGG